MRRLLLLAAVLGTAAAGAPLSAVNKYVAIGDSITVASSWPLFSCPGAGGICPIEFDCTSGCAVSDTQSVRDKCGHPRRLDAWLGPGNYVINRGWGGEKTAAAAVRFASEMTTQCPGSPGDCVAVILMHGTNDMETGISPESATFNLASMVAEAKSRNIDTLLMSIIRDYNPAASKWTTYHGLVVDLAADENLPLADTHASLCLTATCRNANYFLVGSCNFAGPELGTAHLDPDGYNVLTNLIKAQFPGAVPAAPVPTSPAGDIPGTMPDFVWPEDPAARWYELDVDGTTTWWEAAVHCAPGGDCTANPGIALAKTAHSWRVRGRNLRGLGAWSADTNFVVWGTPGTPIAASPTGSFDDVDPFNPPFDWEPYTWSEAADATHYDLEVADGGGPVLQQSFDASVCLASTCTASPGVGLAGDSYTWTVQGRNPATVGTPSVAQAFVVVHKPPGEPTATAPTGELFETAPLYEWLPALGATEYDLEVRDSGGAGAVVAQATNLLASAVCVAGQCSYLESTVLTDPDDYTLRVLGRSAGGDGPPSAPGADFTILACDEPLQEDLSVLVIDPSPVTATETVPHCGPVTAAATAPYIIDTLGDVTVHTRDGFTAYDGFTVKGTLTIRSP